MVASQIFSQWYKNSLENREWVKIWDVPLGPLMVTWFVTYLGLYSKGDQPWNLTGRTDADPVFWSTDVKRWLIVPGAGKDWGQKERRASEDEMAGWHHWCNEHEPGQTPGDGEGQRGLVCCSPRGHKQSVMTGRLNNNISLKLAGLFFLPISLHLKLFVCFNETQNFLLKYTITEWIFFFFKTCHSNIFGPRYCFRTLSLPLWKWSLSLLTLKSDEPFQLLWRAKCRGTDTTRQRGGDKRQCGFHLTPCSPWEPSHHAVRKPKPCGGSPLRVPADHPS